MAEAFHIVFALFPGVTHLDFTGPQQFLCRLPGGKITVVSPDGADIDADGLTFTNLMPIAEVECCDMICVPGGFGTTAACNDEAFVGHIRRLALGARYITSVCTGSLLLGAAGLLEGRHAACHWAWRDLLPLFGAIPDEGRVVRDGNVITGGGVTAGIDFALTILTEVAGEDFAKTMQLNLEYAPAPPYQAGRPETAPKEILEGVQAMYARMRPQRDAEAQSAAAKLKAMA